ncbi:MAG: Tad domain-containing protein [Myxococcaceae bacterium]|nr:Tad domain-containing protein [Myxococcaceae bacterium]
MIFSLTMLLITLMVCLTLSFSMRIREKMEAQSVADLAAYSSAVATARTFNSIALMRRAQTAHLVAMSGVESLISWTSMMRANLNAARVAAAGCPAAAVVLDALNEEHVAIQEKWHELDGNAGVQALNIQILGGHLRGMQGAMYAQLQAAVSGEQDSFAAQLSVLASEGSRYPGELKAGLTNVSLAELEYATSDGRSYAMDMAMATRGYEFITRRQGMPTFDGSHGVLGVLKGAGGSVTVIEGGGSAYWGSSLGHGGRADEADFTWAEDHAEVEVQFPGCALFQVNATAGVKSTDRIDDTDDHWWTPAGTVLGDSDPGMEKQYRHTLGWVDPEFVPSTFIGGMTYNTSDHSRDNLWAQPKLFALVQRDYKKRGPNADPWNLLFRFSFTPDQSRPFDSNGWYLADGTDISVQEALGTGLAYYHRRGHWEEPPNLWNPFWRATLASADVDASGGADVQATVRAPAAAAFQALISAGYKGVH